MDLTWTYRMFAGLKRIARADRALHKACVEAARYLIERLNRTISARSAGRVFSLYGRTGSARWKIIELVD